MANLATIHITDGKKSYIVNKVDFEAGKYKGFEEVGKKTNTSEKTEAEKIAGLSIKKLAKAIEGFDETQLDEVLAAEKAGQNRAGAIEAIEAEKAA